MRETREEEQRGSERERERYITKRRTRIENKEKDRKIGEKIQDRTKHTIFRHVRGKKKFEKIDLRVE